MAIGCGTRQRTVPFVSTFGAFFTRAFDQIRMGAISQANIKCAGSHCGVSIGEDGPSQMALEDIAMFRSIPNSLVFYPSDATSTERACELAANYNGIVFIRTTRPVTAVIYDASETFKPGQSKVSILANRLNQFYSCWNRYSVNCAETYAEKKAHKKTFKSIYH